MYIVFGTCHAKKDKYSIRFSYLFSYLLCIAIIPHTFILLQKVIKIIESAFEKETQGMQFSFFILYPLDLDHTLRKIHKLMGLFF